jgi:hypothetical protein
MTNWGAVMRDAGEGERAEKTRSRRFWLLLVLLVVAGAVLGGVHMTLTKGDPTGTMPLAWGIALAVFYFAAVGIGSWYFFRSVDELEIRDNLLAYTIGAHFYLVLYPGWYFLWKGGLVIEPSHEFLFLGTIIVTGAAYLTLKSRH